MNEKEKYMEGLTTLKKSDWKELDQNKPQKTFLRRPEHIHHMISILKKPFSDTCM